MPGHSKIIKPSARLLTAITGSSRLLIPPSRRPKHGVTRLLEVSPAGCHSRVADAQTGSSDRGNISIYKSRGGFVIPWLERSIKKLSVCTCLKKWATCFFPIRRWVESMEEKDSPFYFSVDPESWEKVAVFKGYSSRSLCSEMTTIRKQTRISPKGNSEDDPLEDNVSTGSVLLSKQDPFQPWCAPLGIFFSTNAIESASSLPDLPSWIASTFLTFFFFNCLLITSGKVTYFTFPSR